MSRHLPRLSCIALLALHLSTAPAEEPANLDLLGPRPGVLLLRNGELLEGKITLAGDRYDVELNDGEIHVKRSEVELFCRDAEQCYERKRSHIDVEKVQDHLELAEWCLRHDLMSQAKSELSQSAALDATHPRIALLERRMKLAAEGPSTAVPSAAQVSQPSQTRQLEQMLREMPQGSVETFNVTIQPLLSSQCSTSGCHGPQAAGSLRLLRTSGGRPLTHRAMLLNLSSVMSVIDRENPSASPLLTAPAGPHGSCKTAIFAQRDAARYRTLVNWVNRVANPSGLASGETVESTANPRTQSGRASKRGSTQRAKDSEPKAVSRRSTRAAESTAAETPQSLPAKSTLPVRSPDGQEPGPIATKDPFDPEIFNQRTAGKKPKE